MTKRISILGKKGGELEFVERTILLFILLFPLMCGVAILYFVPIYIAVEAIIHEILLY